MFRAGDLLSTRLFSRSKNLRLRRRRMAEVQSGWSRKTKISPAEDGFGDSGGMGIIGSSTKKQEDVLLHGHAPGAIPALPS